MTILTKTNPSKIAVIITAAGSSTRIGGSTKKEYLPYKKAQFFRAVLVLF